MMTIASRGDSFASIVGADVIKSFGLVILLFCAPVLACDYPDEGNLPLRRAVSKVKYLPDTEAWARTMHKQGAVVQYALLLDAPHRERGRCYWPLELRADGRLWRRYYVSPDGKSVLRKQGAAARGVRRYVRTHAPEEPCPFGAVLAS